MRSTLDDLSGFVDFCADEGIDAVTLTPALIYDSMVRKGTITESESILHHGEAARNAISRALDTATRRGIPLGYPVLSIGETPGGNRQWQGREPVNAPPRVTPLPEGLACSRPWKEIFVNQDGRIVPCCCGTGIGPVVGHLQEGLETVWNSARIQEVRTALVEQRLDDACRCGVNMAVTRRNFSVEHFLTRFRAPTPHDKERHERCV
jgi:radical SAM protein with 4Fe4S-binding SPASM domain